MRSVEFPAVFLTGYDFLFALAFVFGLVTLSVLRRVREEGESNREAVMRELAGQTRENLRVLNSVPGLNVVASIPISAMRYVPAVAGLDVAAGVAAYQLAATIRSVVTAATRSGATARQVQDRVTRSITRLAKEKELVRRQSTAMALGAVHGALEAAIHTKVSAGRLVQASIVGILRADDDEDSDSLNIIRDAIHGAIQGGMETGLPLDSIAGHAIRAVQQAAPDMGLSEQEATTLAAQTAIQAADDLPESSKAQIRDAALDALFQPEGSDDAENQSD